MSLNKTFVIGLLLCPSCKVLQPVDFQRIRHNTKPLADGELWTLSQKN